MLAFVRAATNELSKNRKFPNSLASERFAATQNTRFSQKKKLPVTSD